MTQNFNFPFAGDEQRVLGLEHIDGVRGSLSRLHVSIHIEEQGIYEL